MNDRTRLIAFGIYTAIIFIVGWLSHGWYDAQKMVPVAAHEQKDLGHGVAEAARAPGSLPPVHVLPPGALSDAEFRAAIEGGKPEVRPGVRVVARAGGGKPDEVPAATAASGQLVASQAEVDRCEALLQCPAITVDGTLITNADGTPDLLLSAGGRHIDAVFSPAAIVTVVKVHPNALGIARPLGLPGASMGLVVERDFQALPLRLSGTAFMLNGKPAAMVGALYRW